MRATVAEEFGDALGGLAPGGSLTALGYVASRKTTIDVTRYSSHSASGSTAGNRRQTVRN